MSGVREVPVSCAAPETPDRRRQGKKMQMVAHTAFRVCFPNVHVYKVSESNPITWRGVFSFRAMKYVYAILIPPQTT